MALKAGPAWLAEGELAQGSQILRQNADKGLPSVMRFVQRLKMIVRRQLGITHKVGRERLKGK